MATKKRNGKVLDLTTRVLIEIRDEVRRTNERLETGFGQVNSRLDQTNERIDQTNERIGQTNERLDQTNERLDVTNERLDQTIKRLDVTNARLDNLRDIAGDRYRELDARVRVLEARAS